MIHPKFDFLRTSLYKFEKLSKLKKIIMENEKDSNMATPINLPILLSMNGKQCPLVSFAVPMITHSLSPEHFSGMRY